MKALAAPRDLSLRRGDQSKEGTVALNVHERNQTGISIYDPTKFCSILVIRLNCVHVVEI